MLFSDLKKHQQKLNKSWLLTFSKDALDYGRKKVFQRKGQRYKNEKSWIVLVTYSFETTYFKIRKQESKVQSSQNFFKLDPRKLPKIRLQLVRLDTRKKILNRRRWVSFYFFENLIFWMFLWCLFSCTVTTTPPCLVSLAVCDTWFRVSWWAMNAAATHKKAQQHDMSNSKEENGTPRRCLKNFLYKFWTGTLSRKLSSLPP